MVGPRHGCALGGRLGADGRKINAHRRGRGRHSGRFCNVHYITYFATPGETRATIENFLNILAIFGSVTGIRSCPARPVAVGWKYARLAYSMANGGACRQIMRGDDTRDRIKVAARRLFAERGVDGVSIREIVAAAGQRNVGSLHYYFRTKDALVRELIVDGVRHINERRNAMLDALEKRGGPACLRDIVDILVMPAVAAENTSDEEETYFRFLIMLLLNHRQLFTEALGKQWNGGYDRCVAHIRRFLAEVPAPILDQRLVFADIYLSATLAAREATIGAEDGMRVFWTCDYTMRNLADTVEALLDCRTSVETIPAIAASQPVKRGKSARMRMAVAK